jgi:hypothetical protein
MTTMTPEDAIKAASSVARDIADGRVSPSELEGQAVAELRDMVGEVVGPDDPAWPLQCDITRRVLALDGLPADELAEWLAVARQRAGEPVSAPDPDQTPPEPSSFASGTLSADSEDVAPEPPADAEPEQPAVAQPTPPGRADGYDPLAHWPPSRSLRRSL